MVDLYKYRKPVRRHWYAKFRFRRRLIITAFILVGLILAFVWLDARDDKSQPKTSLAENTNISDNAITFQTDFFEFQDIGKWVLNKSETTAQKFVYFKYRGVQPQQQLTIYVNQEPIPLYLSTSRVIPVRIVNDNSLDVTNVYGPCGNTYGPDELHQVKVVTIEGSKMLCDPDTPQYSVVLSEVGGNWQLDMKRKNGTLIKVVITFKDITFNPGPESILRIADSFKVR